MIVQALPSSGKSTLAAGSERFFDTDVFVEKLGYKGRFDELLKDEAATASFFESCREADKNGMLLTNLNLAKFRMRVDRRFGYRPDDYVEHIKLAGRTDLLEKFDAETLESWARDYEALDNVTWLAVDEYLSDTDLML